MRRGNVVNIEKALRSVLQAIEAAELMSGREVRHCWISIGGASIEGLISRGVVAVTGKPSESREISEADIERVLIAARAVKLPIDREIIEVIPLSYTVDQQNGIRDPRDVIGVRLECDVNIISCSTTGARNLISCVNRSGFIVDGLVLQTLAAGSAVLTDEEKELGVALVDLGGGTTNVLVYSSGAPWSTFSVPVGGNQVTGDISIVKNIAIETAEKIKINSGCCWGALIEGLEDEIIVPGMGGRAPFPIPRSLILEIIEPRMREIFNLVREQLEKQISGARPLSGGIVLTGGGAKLLGVADLAAQVFQMPVRIGEPLSLGGLAADFRSPEFATAVGLVLEGDSRERQAISGNAKSKLRESPAGRGGIFSSFYNWLKTEFF
ncbi:MAG: cell division protein FtsA [Termitinemataceae bacterium]|jgi:cell division protein FtsA|nr:MAG: cell division protein FtsA [Termitinemataceae bacterium]